MKEARLKEIKTEILNSEKLKAHFEDNPQDLDALRHDRSILQAKVQSHMKHIPRYLMSKSTTQAVSDNSASMRKVPFRKNAKSKSNGKGGNNKSTLKVK